MNFHTSGFATTKGSQLNAGSSISATNTNPTQARVPVDTGQASSVAPQQGGIIPGTQPLDSGQDALTALAGGGKAGATQLHYGVNRISVCATAANSCLMPYAFPGAMCYVRNDGAQSTTIFGRGTDTIDAVATGTGNAQAAAKGKLYFGTGGTGDGSDAGTWVSLLGA
jgi:hypothetical protein